MKHRDWMVGIALRRGVGRRTWGRLRLIWGWPTNWYARDVTNLPASPENDIIRYGHSLIVDTAKHIGKAASRSAKALCRQRSCLQELPSRRGLRPFAAPFVSTFATFPMLVDDQVITLKERINGCMLRSMNGKDLPKDSPEMEALIAYIKFLGQGTPEGVRIAGMGLFLLRDPPLAADGGRGEKVYADLLRKLPRG